MKAKGGNWTFDELNKFLTNPRGYIPGTAMTFAGLSRDQQRADVIAFLRHAVGQSGAAAEGGGGRAAPSAASPRRAPSRRLSRPAPAPAAAAGRGDNARRPLRQGRALPRPFVAAGHANLAG